MTGVRSLRLCATAVFALSIICPVTAAPDSRRQVVLVIWDGMRSDFVNAKYTPTLDKLAREGVRFRNHHSVYPTATNVNGGALATGCYPNRNGICANLEYRPQINRREPVDISDPELIKRSDQITGGKHLLVPTFPELLRAAGKEVALVGTKSVALLFDRKNDWTVVPMRNKPLTTFAGAPIDWSKRQELTKLLGPFPDAPEATPKQRNDFATRALTEFFWRAGVPDFSLLWLSEPDYAQHNHAPGSPEAIAAIKTVDNNLATVLDVLDSKGVRDSTDVLVLSDHGFSTIRRSIDLLALLHRAGFRAFKELPEKSEPGDILVCGNAGTVLFYVQNREQAVTQRLVDWLQHTDFADVILTRDGLPGTFRSDAVHCEKADGPDVAIAFRWSEEKNQFGVSGTIDADWNRPAGEGTHATLSPSDVGNFCIAAGPDFRRGFDSSAPSGNIDIAPIILEIFELPQTNRMNGRVLREAMSHSNDSEPEARTESLRASHGQWRQHLEVKHLGSVDYLDQKKTFGEAGAK